MNKHYLVKFERHIEIIMPPDATEEEVIAAAVAKYNRYNDNDDHLMGEGNVSEVIFEYLTEESEDDEESDNED